MINYLGNIFRYVGFRNMNKLYCIKLFNPTYRFVKKLKIDLNEDYERISKYHNSVFGYKTGKVPLFMKSTKNIGGSSEISMLGQEIKNDEQFYIMNKKNLKKLLLANVDDFIKEHPNILHVLSENIEETKKRLNENDEKYINLYEQFKNVYDELFILSQISEENIEKYVSKKRLNTIRNIIQSYTTLLEIYHEKHKYMIFDEGKVKMHMVLVLFDVLNCYDFEKTKQLLELFYADKAKELGIDFQLIRDIFNLEEDEKEKREEKVLKMYKEGMFDEDTIEQYEDEDTNEEEDNYDD
jgi:hypothetical protein